MNQIKNHLLDHLHEFVGIARKRLGDADLGADAVQGSLVKALKAKDQIHNQESAKAWFYRILGRNMIDFFRRCAAQGAKL